MNREYRIYDTEQRRYVTDERIWLIAADGTLYYLKTENAVFVKAKNCVVEWATGLTDRLGKKIYESDIVEGIYNHKRFIIAWDYMDACFALTTKSGGCTTYHYDEYTMVDTHEMEVIGNKWDNPELLKAK